MTMTKQQLAAAQFLLGTIQRAQELADELNPGRDPSRIQNLTKQMFVKRLDSIVDHASAGFGALTGRSWHNLSVIDFNTEHPAEWTRDVKQF